MTTKTKSSKTRQRHSQQYKTESLALAEKVGVPTAARQLGLHESQLYSWRSKARLAQVGIPAKTASGTAAKAAAVLL